MKDAIIHIAGLHKSFGDNHVLIDLSLDLYRGENLIVVGRSGSGKSVLIKCIVGLIKPDKGEILIDGENVCEMRQKELDLVRQEIGFVFQSGALYDSMTVKENLEFHLRNTPLARKKKEREERVMEVLDSVGLLHTVDMMPSELSGGMRKRASLARSLVLYPKIMLYDEPTSGLDPITSLEISRLILDVQKKFNISSIIITHDLDCARITSNRMIILIGGTCYFTGTYAETQSSTDPEIRRFFIE